MSDNMRATLYIEPDCGARVETHPSRIEVEYLHEGSDFSLEIDGMHHGKTRSLYVCPAHTIDEFFHQLRLELDDGIEISIQPEIVSHGERASLIVKAHRRVPNSLYVIYDRIYLTKSGKWRPLPDGWKTPDDALRIDLAAVVPAIDRLTEDRESS